MNSILQETLLVHEVMQYHNGENGDGSHSVSFQQGDLTEGQEGLEYDGTERSAETGPTQTCPGECCWYNKNGIV